MDISEAMVRIKAAGLKNSRAVPMPKQNAISGKYQIEVFESGTWSVVLAGATKSLADSIMQQAANKVICG